MSQKRLLQFQNCHSIINAGTYYSKRQFVTILSLNKTRDERDGYFLCHCAGICRFCFWAHKYLCVFFYLMGTIAMHQKGTFMEHFNPCRYAVINEKNPREIVMLRGTGCSWRRCRFCDYHLDSSEDEAANYALNQEQLLKVTGIHHKLEVINSGSFVDLDSETLSLIEQICQEKQISQLHFECHWRHRDAIFDFRNRFASLGIELKIKTGVEMFDALFRESYLDKGIDTDNPAELAAYFDEVCLLQGIPGQTAKSMDQDIQTGLANFERVCINIMQENRRPVKPDPMIIKIFARELYPKYIQDPRVDILMENTAFGVGGVVENAK